MPANTRGSKYTVTKNQINGEKVVAERRALVGNMYLQGFRQDEIADELKITHSTVHNDLAYMRAEWNKNAIMAFSERQALELAKIDAMEIMAWREWVRSRKNAVTVKETEESQIKFKVVGDIPVNKRDKNESAPMVEQSIIPSRRGRERTVRGRLGEDKYLARIAWCVEMRCKILGIVRDSKPINVNAMSVNWQEIAGQGSGAEEIENAIKVIESSPDRVAPQEATKGDED